MQSVSCKGCGIFGLTSSTFKIWTDTRSGWIANYDSNATLYSSWNIFCGVKVMSMPFLITMTGIVFGKKLLKIRSWTNIIILWLTNNLHSTRLMGWKDLIPQIQTGFFPAVCFSLTTKLYLHKFTFICYISAQWTYLQPPLLSLPLPLSLFNVRFILCCLQMFLRDLSLWELTLQCQICSLVFGSTRLTGLLLVIS